METIIKVVKRKEDLMWKPTTVTRGRRIFPNFVLIISYHSLIERIFQRKSNFKISDQLYSMLLPPSFYKEGKTKLLNCRED